MSETRKGEKKTSCLGRRWCARVHTRLKRSRRKRMKNKKRERERKEERGREKKGQEARGFLKREHKRRRRRKKKTIHPEESRPAMKSKVLISFFFFSSSSFADSYKNSIKWSEMPRCSSFSLIFRHATSLEHRTFAMCTLTRIDMTHAHYRKRTTCSTE